MAPSRGRLGPHVDGSPVELQAVLNMSTVNALSGGFTIYPSSAIRLYPTSQQALNWFSTEESEAEMARIFDEVRPVEFTGQPGDVIFIHGCTVKW